MIAHMKRTKNLQTEILPTVGWNFSEPQENITLQEIAAKFGDQCYFSYGFSVSISISVSYFA